MAAMVPVVMAFENGRQFYGDGQASNESSMSEEQSEQRKKENELIEKKNKENMKPL
jgi:hypothetical protein